jgi:hypothetical protein
MFIQILEEGEWTQQCSHYCRKMMQWLYQHDYRRLKEDSSGYEEFLIYLEFYHYLDKKNYF